MPCWRCWAGRWAHSLPTPARRERLRFCALQGRSLLIAVVGLVGVLSIWFDNPGTLTTAVGRVNAGLAFALQRVVTSLAGYFVILRGKNFTVGEYAATRSYPVGLS